jgi:cytochrome P450
MSAVFDPLDPAHFLDPDDRLRDLRATCPVSEPRPGMHFVATDEHAREALRSYRSFSNRSNFSVEGGVGRDFEEMPENVAELDPPRHSAMRRLLLAAFTPSTVEASVPFIDATARGLVGAAVERGGFELVVGLAQPLPATVTAHLVGVPEADHELFSRWTFEITSTLPFGFLETQAWADFTAYLKSFIADRRAATTPPDDLVSRLLQAEVDGQRLTDAEVRMSVWQLVVAGNDTTTRLIANLVHRLLDDRSRWERVQADRSLVAAAVEESLRLDPPLSWVMRTCVGSTELGDTTVDDGARLVVGLASANRDDRRWVDPDAFSLDRATPEEHLAFGYGIHTCLGASLARREAAVALGALLDLVPDARLADGFRYARQHNAMLLGPERIDLVWGTD